MSGPELATASHPSARPLVGPGGDTRLPADATIVLAPGVRELEPGVLRTPDPVRVVRLRRDHAASRSLVAGRPVAVDRVGPTVARRLVDAGVAEVRARDGASADVAEVRRRTTVVVPIRDRADELERCLPGLVAQTKVLVVDDGSRDPERICRVAQRHGAEVLRRDVNGGPGAARDTGSAAATTEVVVLVDSDVDGPDGWIGALLPALDDPTVAVAAPRVASCPGPSRLERFEARHSPLDLGATSATVHPAGRTAYLPSAAWVVRRSALRGGFTPGLRVGEDVDAIWRLHAAGWRAVYRPHVVVHHAPRPHVRAALRQRASYAAGATALAVAHPGGAPPLRLSPWSAVALLAAATLHPLGAIAAAAAVGWAIRSVARTLPVRRRTRSAAVLVGRGLERTARAVVRASVRSLLPVTVVVALLLPRVAALLAAGWLLDVLADRWSATRADRRRARVGRRTGRLTVVEEVVGRLLDDLAYGVGLWAGAWRGRTAAALLPRSAARPRRRASAGGG